MKFIKKNIKITIINLGEGRRQKPMNRVKLYLHNPTEGWNKKVCKKGIFYYITSKYTIKNIPLRGYVCHYHFVQHLCLRLSPQITNFKFKYK